MIKLTNRKAFVLGAIIGIVLISVTILTGSLNIFYTPLWQEILFFPGFLVGGLFYRYFSSLLPAAGDIAGYIGILAVAASYGFATIGLWCLFRLLNRFSKK
jgi:hypothetical protein